MTVMMMMMMPAIMCTIVSAVAWVSTSSAQPWRIACVPNAVARMPMQLDREVER